MSTVVLNNAPKAQVARLAVLENGSYALVGFKAHTMEFKIITEQLQELVKKNADAKAKNRYDACIDAIELTSLISEGKVTADAKPSYDSVRKVRFQVTYAPVVVKLDSNGVPVGLYAINRSDFLNTTTRQVYGDSQKVLSNEGDVVDDVTEIVSREGFFADALWMQVVLNKYRSIVFNVETNKFTAQARSGKSYSAHVYKMMKNANMTFNFNMQMVAINNLLTQRGWKTQDLHGFDGQPINFQYRNDAGQLVNVQLASDGRLLN